MKTTYSYDHYFDQAERKKIISELQGKYPQLLTSEVILHTAEDREVFALTVTNPATGKPEDKAAFYVDGNTHAGEVTGMMAAMYTLDGLLTNYGSNERITYLLDHFTFYIIPCVSPDGSDTYLHTPYMLRSVNREYKKPEKGLVKKDIDGDGVIRMMRIQTPYGNFKKDPENQQLMLVREPDDVEGEFYNIFTEGEILGYDGVNIEMANDAWGLDFNRNYPFGWFNDFRQSGAGPYPLSNPETKAVVDFVLAHENICAVLTHHTSGGMLLCPPGTYSSSKAPHFDNSVYKQIGAICEKTLGYPYVSIFDSFMGDQENYDSGAFDDWCYETRGVYATTLELWNLEERAGKPHQWRKQETLKEQLERFKACYNWIQENSPQAFKPWTEFDHPQLGRVEIGGFDAKRSFQNPPDNLLESETEKTFAFTLGYASLLPNIIVEKCEKTDLGSGLCQVEIVIANTGYLPTYISNKAQQIGANKGITVEVDAEVVNGKKKFSIGELGGFSTTGSSASFYGNIGTYGHLDVKKKISFICKAGQDPVQVKISGFKINDICLSI